MTRLTVQERADRALIERDFQQQVTDLAALFGWEYAHFRPAVTTRGWRTPVSGSLGMGFPDLVLARFRDQRLLFVELKREAGRLSEAQEYVHRVLGDRCVVWRPSDLSSGVIAAALR